MYQVIKLLKISYGFKFVNKHVIHDVELKYGKGKYIYAMWHHNTIAGIMSQWGEEHTILLSRSKDGDLMEFCAKKLNFKAARGSSSRGGKQAKAIMIENLKQGIPAAITPDGPRGPAKIIKLGVLDIARMSGAAIIPMSATSDDYWELRSWDKFRIPKLPSKTIIRYGEPLFIPSETKYDELSSFKKELEKRINIIEEMAIQDHKNW